MIPKFNPNRACVCCVCAAHEMSFLLLSRIVFPHRKKNVRKDEIVQKRYVLDSGTFMFGPLHCGKTRERYQERRYPENAEVLTISNTSLMDANVSFCFQYDHNAATFLLEPASMTLQPGESKVCC